MTIHNFMSLKIITPLTATRRGFMLTPLSQKTKVGSRSPDNQGPKRPLSTVVFLCPSKTQAALRRLDSVMAGCIGQPLKRLAGSLAGTANLIQSATQQLAVMGGGLSLYQGVPAMRHFAQNPAESSQAKAYKSLFNLIKRTPEGKRVICQDLTFAQAAALVAEIPALIVKFSRMEALS
jgi:hypothetical protein